MKAHLLKTAQSSHATAARVYKEESAHWYHQDGKPCYEVPRVTGGGMRPTTLGDARKLKLLPSVTTIISVLDKPGLTAWLIEQAALAVLTSKRNEGEDLDAFVKRVLQVERQQDQETKKAADLGTRIHRALDLILMARKDAKEEPKIDDDLKPFVFPVLELPLLKGRIMDTEFCVVGDGYAGRVDLKMEAEHSIDYIDFKATKTMPKTEPWTEHKMQLAAYAKTEGNTGSLRIRCFNVYISTREPGLVVPLEVQDWQTIYANGFKPVSEFWKWKNNYNPNEV